MNLDNNMETSRALHRIVRSMHDGHCPSCSYLSDADNFYQPMRKLHQCLNCGFAITDEESKAALELFKPYLQKSLDIFRAWRKERNES